MTNFRQSNFLLILIFTVAASLVFFVAGLTFKQLQKLSEDTNWVYHSQKISLDLEHLYANLKDIETERRNYILDKDFTEANGMITSRIKENNALLQNLHRELADNESQLKKLKILDALVNHKYFIVQQTFSNKGTGTEDPMLVKQSLMAGKHIMHAINKTVNDMLDNEQILLQQRRSQFLFSQKSTPVYLYGISILALGVLGMAFYQTFRDLKIQKNVNSQLQLAIDTSKMAERIGNFGVWTYNPQTGIYNFSDNQKKLLNIPQHLEANFSIIEDRIEAEDWKDFQLDVKRIFAGAQIDPRVTRFTDNSGKVKHLVNNLELINIPSAGKMLLGITRDITEEVQNKENLASAYKDLQFYFSSSRAAERIGNYGFWRWDKKDNKYWFSDNLYRIFGLRNDGYRDISVMKQRVHPKDLDKVNTSLNKLFAGENVEDFVHRIYRKNDGKLRYLQIIARKMDWDTDLSYLIFTTDVTDLVLANQHLEEQNRILDTNNRELQAFNYVASHDLQEPLRKIETFIGRLQDKDYNNLSETGRQYLDRTRASAGRMRNLIDDLLQFSRTTRGDAAFEMCDLNILLEEAKENLQTLIEQKNAVIAADRLPDLNVVPFQIQQLFTNLISNSIKYSKGDTAPVIRITADKILAENEKSIAHCSRGEFYKISFADNGIGFNNAYSDKIFQLFNRLHGKKEYEGTGIGLSICKKIVENHKGCITAEGKENFGSKFTIYLPV